MSHIHRETHVNFYADGSVYCFAKHLKTLTFFSLLEFVLSLLAQQATCADMNLLGLWNYDIAAVHNSKGLDRHRVADIEWRI